MIFCNFMFAIAWKTFLLLWDWNSQCCKQKRSKLTCKFKSIRKKKYIWHVLFCSAWRCILAWRISAPFALTSMGKSGTGRVCPGRTSIGCTSPLKVIRACDPVPSCWIKFQLRKPELHINSMMFILILMLCSSTGLKWWFFPQTGLPVGFYLWRKETGHAGGRLHDVFVFNFMCISYVYHGACAKQSLALVNETWFWAIPCSKSVMWSERNGSKRRERGVPPTNTA